MTSRYEAVRSAALSGAAEGYRHGLALLVGRGLAAWMTVAAAPPAPDRTPRPSSEAPSPPPWLADADELVHTLAAMTLAHT